MGLTVFTRFAIHHRTRGGTILVWDLHPLFSPSTPITFTVRASRSGTGDWYDVATITDNYYYFIDSNRWVWAKDVRIHYQVEITDADGEVYQSAATRAYGTLSKEDRLKAQHIVEKEDRILYQKKAGVQGQLFKRRHWGEGCTECTDFDTGESSDSKCGRCFGTGLAGGYFPPVEVWMLLKADSGRRQKQEDSLGTVENQVKNGRTLACPWLDTNDVWVNCQNDQRFYVQKVTPIEFRGVPIIFDPVELRLAQSSDIVYTLSDEQLSSISA